MEKLKPDEFPAILQTGETVLSRTQVKEIHTEMSKASKPGAEGMRASSNLTKVLAPIFHTGGMVGGSSSSTRMISSAVFNNAPRFHDGLMSNEWMMPQTGETRGQVREIRQKTDMEPYAGRDPGSSSQKERPINITFNGVTDMNSFRRNESQVQATVTRGLSRASRRDN
jgi:hypothetical protein